MEKHLEVTIVLTSENTFDVEFYEPESGCFNRISCHDIGETDHLQNKIENTKLAMEIHSWVGILRNFQNIGRVD